MCRTSLGPNGMNKIIINHLDKQFLTKDTGVVLKELDVHHPAAKLLVNAVARQENEMGDNTNYCATIAGELLSQAEGLIKSGLHPSDILSGYELAWKRVLEILTDSNQYCRKLENLKDITEVTKYIESVIGTKLMHSQEEFLAPKIAQACISILPKDPENFNTEYVRVAKMLGGSLLDSSVIKGLLILRNVEGSITKTDKCTVAVFNCPLDTRISETKDTVLLKNADELLNYTKSEEDHMESIIKGIVNSGVKCVVVGGTVSDMAMHYLDNYNIMVLRILSKFEIRRICKSLGATLLTRLGPPSHEEMGHADRIYVDEIGSQKCVIFERDSEDNKLATILIRGATNNLLDNIEKTIEDGVNAYKAFCKDNNFMPGAGATEMNLSIQLKKYAKEQSGLEQYSIDKFGEAFEVIPKTLAENAGFNVNETMANLFSKNVSNGKFGINVKNGDIMDAYEMKVFDHLEIKKWAIKYAVDAVLTILRVDQIILSKPAGGPDLSKKQRDPEAEEF